MSGCSVDLYAIIAAAAPLDYFLQKGSPTWQLLGVGLCDERRDERTQFGRRAPLQAHACYRHGASGNVDFGMMAACYQAGGVSATKTKHHAQQCHPSVDLPWKGVESCLTTSTDYNNRTERSV
jgi:hypothetical protein